MLDIIWLHKVHAGAASVPNCFSGGQQDAQPGISGRGARRCSGEVPGQDAGVGLPRKGRRGGRVSVL